MLPSSSGSTGTNSGQGRRRGGLNWIQNDDLSTTPRKAKILGVKGNPEGKYGPSVILKFALDGQIKFWSINVKRDPNYKILEKAFGLEENDWVSQQVMLFLEKDDFSEDYYKRIQVPAKGDRK